MDGGWDSFTVNCDETQEKEGRSSVSVQVLSFFGGVHMHIEVSAGTF